MPSLSLIDGDAQEAESHPVWKHFSAGLARTFTRRWTCVMEIFVSSSGREVFIVSPPSLPTIWPLTAPSPSRLPRIDVGGESSVESDPLRVAVTRLGARQCLRHVYAEAENPAGDETCVWSILCASPHHTPPPLWFPYLSPLVPEAAARVSF